MFSQQVKPQCLQYTINCLSLTFRRQCLVSAVRYAFPVKPALNSGQDSCCPAELHQVLFVKIQPTTLNRVSIQTSLITFIF